MRPAPARADIDIMARLYYHLIASNTHNHGTVFHALTKKNYLVAGETQVLCY